ncbi:heterokaryon incompatibility, partial [Cadophora sp. DSE1049]
YTALSYVWRSSERVPATSVNNVERSVLTGCPKVITDSVETVLKLGFRYLWVDRLCIYQLDEEERHAQIGQMDLIYAKAQLTIIAATTDPDVGLPGVAGSRRKQQPNVNIGDITIASTLSHPQIIMAKSKRVTRGWTYQEGLLSRHRLIFTDEQVLFKCHGMHCTE